MKKTNKPLVSIPNGIPPLFLKKYPNLSPTELKVCALLAFNLSSKTVSEITARNIRTIEYTRNNIRKKMKLNSRDNLVTHLILLASEGGLNNDFNGE